MNTHKQPGTVIPLTAPAGGVVTDEGFIIGSLFVVAANAQVPSTPAGEIFEGFVGPGVVVLVKEAPQVWAEGDDIWWDDTAKQANNVSGDMRIGVAAVAAVSAATKGDVRLNAIGATPLITTAELADGSVTLAKTAQFVSAEQTGTGAPQNIPHGLGAVPAAVFISPTDLAPAVIGDYTVVEGAHDATNVILTVTTSKKFKVIAWA